ncbi:Glutathione-regulated potassium-efflux system ATP-binding protein [Paramagnetospirillum magnetotacticum MS-1]|uniref:Glutathione-regulated potassium-efflux system ATP-binding protein n=1 Tax=Paramagnetospirillum magnetotacticum MS-1 TaxID=272627 RepID=A0A0C2YW11_PARME|nr:ATP-binding cassette domain-containing protein [Paramagnetospirillum magnetotacticum]KIL99303.1 Glutathione-regulated potassium-efflux system ATP-binding protein [Paramagnetospirillum magnetotacticum MS-1]
MLHINDLTFRYGGRTIFEAATVHIPAGQRVGLVGRNGTGKTTLFKLILGELHADGGEINMRPRARLGRLAQEAPEGEISLIDCVLAADTERTALFEEAENCHDGHRIAEIHERLTAIDAHSAPSRAASILSGLGFDSEAQQQPVSDFSGGWRMRVALAAALFANPDLLLLDEPTNHLDLEATLWLQSHLAVYPGTLVVISHDRELLNEVATRIIHLENGKLNGYGGNYDRFEATRRARMELQSKAFVKQQEQRKKIQSFIDRFKAKATKAAQAQSRVKMLERMEVVVPVVEDRGMSFDFPDPEELSPPIIAIDNGVAGYGEKVVLRKLDIRITMEDRIALLGANGNGKSTLAKILSGRMDLLGGQLRKPSKLKIGYFAQHQTEELRLDETPFDHMALLMKGLPEAKVRAQLGRFGFEQDRANVKVSSLSGGEKSRLLFALMSREAPHLMILDEPTNHLDIDAREALVSALNAYDGAVILISHDPHLIELAADSLWLVGDGAVRPFDGDLAAYRRLLLDQARDAKRSARKDAGADKSGDGAQRKADRKAAAGARAQLAPLRKAVQAAEKALEDLVKEQKALAAKLADPKLYQGPPAKVTELRRQEGDLARKVEAAELAWLCAQEELEAAQA